MHTHTELANAAAAVILAVDTVARLSKAPPAERIKLVSETIVDVLKLAQDELLASQQETAVALASALNMAQGK